MNVKLYQEYFKLIGEGRVPSIGCPNCEEYNLALVPYMNKRELTVRLKCYMCDIQVEPGWVMDDRLQQEMDKAYA